MPACTLFFTVSAEHVQSREGNPGRFLQDVSSCVIIAVYETGVTD
jgi:hypothetical protein